MRALTRAQLIEQHEEDLQRTAASRIGDMIGKINSDPNR